MLKTITLLICTLFALPLYANEQWQTPFERSNGLDTAHYEEGLDYYKALAKHFDTIQISSRGPTDSGEPLHLVLFSHAKDFDIARNHRLGRNILLINNAIHPGEPDGVDASMMILRDIAQNKILAKQQENLLIAIIPFYNIGGTLNRNEHSRVNQNGPRHYGFRGNAKNYDLNRDFIKSDSLNSRSFAAIFHQLDPDLLIDTHVSNGADYPYVMTLDYSQKDKLGGALGNYLDKILLPDIYRSMAKNGFESIPYVNAWSDTPDKGWEQFMDWPRYSSGYAALFQTPAFMSETHMLKPYPLRVEATYTFIKVVIEHLATKGRHLQKLRASSREKIKKQTRFAISWAVDKSKPSMIEFNGYAAESKISEVSGLPRLWYNQNKPFKKMVPYYDNFIADIVIKKPRAYAFSQAWKNIAELMTLNGIAVSQFTQDETLEVEVYIIEDYQNSEQPYEGHFLHSDVKLKALKQKINFRKGDYYIEANQAGNRYIIETLEPQAKDSFFAWNFFDTHLQQKEHYSAYVFEDHAAKLLKENPNLKARLETQRKIDKDFRENASAQLNFIYQHSAHHEPEHLRYPVFRILD